MKQRIQGIIIGILISILVASTSVAAMTGTIQKNLAYNNIKITINGTEIKPTDANGTYVEPFIIDGTTYLPVRAIANALGLGVNWDGANNTVVLVDSKTQAEYDQAVEAAKSIADLYATVYPNLIRDMLIDNYSFSAAAANYAVFNAGIDWNFYAETHAEECVLKGAFDGMVVSQGEVMDYLAERGYKIEQINAAVAKLDIEAIAKDVLGDSYSGGSETDNNDNTTPTVAYVTPYGKKYHYSYECAGPNGSDIDIARAKQLYSPCEKCVW